jgi:7SK snRNA methylphosphate capping enzyme
MLTCSFRCSLSVTKWVHLNWGDDGLITLFSKIWRLLQPGGIFVMEPQPWKSYENNRRVSEVCIYTQVYF